MEICLFLENFEEKKQDNTCNEEKSNKRVTFKLATVLGRYLPKFCVFRRKFSFRQPEIEEKETK